METDAVSFVSGTSAAPLQYRSVDQVLRDAAADTPQGLGLVMCHQGRRLTFAALDAAVERLAHGFSACGLEAGDRIGIWAPNCLEWVLTLFAAARAGLILVNVNPAYRRFELEHALRTVGCRALVFAREHRGARYDALLRELLPELPHASPGLQAACLPELKLLVHLGDEAVEGTLGFAELERLGEHRRLQAAAFPMRDADEIFNIQFTSGTTGRPKGAALTHFNIVNNAFFVAERMQLSAHDRLCVPVPLYHCFGMVLGLLSAMTRGAAAVFPGDGFDPLEVLTAVAGERCTALHGVPTMFIAELEHPRFKEFDLSSLRTGIMAGSPCPIAVMRRVVTEMHMPEVTIAYGMTETSPASFQSATDDPLERRVTTVGRVHPHAQVKIVDAAGRIVPRGVAGELLTRGYLVMRGYWGDPERTREAIDAGGWMHTGDLATIDAQGYCNIVGRVKDLIIRGGENISPREIEELLYQHPAVLDVAVVGVPDPRYGEAVCACIRLRDRAVCTEEDIREFCRVRIAHFKVPRHVRFMETFPMTLSGKIQKFLLRAQLRAELGLKESPSA
jgi:fatty-acyl-CoA synthase